MRVVAVLVLSVALAACDGPELPRPAPPVDITQQATGRVGERVHLTGCDAGGDRTSMVTLWKSPRSRRAVARLSGGDSQSCEGAVVIVHGREIGDGEVFYEVEAVLGREQGWVEAAFLGRRLGATDCSRLFASLPDTARQCMPEGIGFVETIREVRRREP